jgi:endo-1,4-beta-D-glucanase Y
MRRCLVLIAMAALALSACGGGGGAPSQQELAKQESTRFLEHFVDPDGRVVRRDQGGDTVSEGQAYAMLLAVAANDRETFGRVWTWTQRNLQRDDGLLSWHWQAGHVDDDSPSADADLDAAHALALAARRFQRPGLAAEARRMGEAIRATETIDTSAGRVLAAGPWASGQRLSNPSYADPGAMAALARLGDGTWKSALRANTQMVGSVTTALPPDWAHVGDDGRATPTGAPGDRRPPAYAFDAARVPIRFAAGCTESGRKLAARLWPHLREQPALLPRRLDGRPAAGAKPSSAGLAAAAAAAAAAGRSDEAAKLLDRASAMEEGHTTYFGSALVALTRAGVMTSAFGSCKGV